MDKEAAAAKTNEASSVSAGGKDGFFTLQSADKSFKLRVGGYLQADGRFFLNDEDPARSNTFLLRRVRPVLEGTVFKYYDFRIMPDFGGGTATIQDAYLRISYWPQGRLQFGKFKSPVGLERLQSGTALLFVERGLPTNLVPNRDVGVQLDGDLGSGVLNYAVGVFNGVTDGGSADTEPSNNDGKDVAARIFAHPFRSTEIDSLKGLGVGISGSLGNEQGSQAAPNLPTYRTPAQQILFSYAGAVAASGSTPAQPAVTADGTLSRVSPQAYYYWGPFGLLGEYARSSQEVIRGAANAARLTHTAQQVAVSYVLTGEAASYKGLKPKNSFEPGKEGWGAFELKARYNKLSVDSDAFPTYASPTTSAEEATAWAAGLNWYLSPAVKIYLDYEVTTFTGGGGGTTAAPLDRENESVIMERFQINF
jgi:phosphate-selective porin OprO/OprP